MKKVKLNNNLHICSITSGISKPYLCPLYASTKGTPQFCGSWCVWFDIENKWRTKTSVVDFDGENYKIVTCKGTPIGELVEDES